MHSGTALQPPDHKSDVLTVTRTLPHHSISREADHASCTVERLCQLLSCVLLQAVHPLRQMDKSQLFGKGKLEELTHHIRRRRNDITAVVIGTDMLSALQLATLQDLWRVAVYDRCDLINCQSCVVQV